MESAKEVAIAINKRYFTPATITSWSTWVEEYIAKRDAAIRKECADKAVEWAMTTLGPLIMNSETRDELRATIEGRP